MEYFEQIRLFIILVMAFYSYRQISKTQSITYESQNQSQSQVAQENSLPNPESDRIIPLTSQTQQLALNQAGEAQQLPEQMIQQAQEIDNNEDPQLDLPQNEQKANDVLIDLDEEESALCEIIDNQHGEIKVSKHKSIRKLKRKIRKQIAATEEVIRSSNIIQAQVIEI